MGKVKLSFLRGENRGQELFLVFDSRLIWVSDGKCECDVMDPF